MVDVESRTTSTCTGTNISIESGLLCRGWLEGRLRHAKSEAVDEKWSLAARYVRTMYRGSPQTSWCLSHVQNTQYATVLCTREGPDLILAARHAKLGCTSGPRPCLAAGGTLCRNGWDRTDPAKPFFLSCLGRRLWLLELACGHRRTRRPTASSMHSGGGIGLTTSLESPRHLRTS